MSFYNGSRGQAEGFYTRQNAKHIQRVSSSRAAGTVLLTEHEICKFPVKQNTGVNFGRFVVSLRKKVFLVLSA